MKIAVINSGSSSIKFKLYLMPQSEVLAHIHIEKISEGSSKTTFKYKDKTKVFNDKIDTHDKGLSFIDDILKEYKIIEDFSSFDAIAHRVVHGGDFFKSATLIDENLIYKIKKLIPLSVLHNKANVEGILISLQKAPNVPQIAVFDTSFHASLPKEAYLYALPYELYKEHNIRRFGFHGISHSYVMKKVAHLMRKSPHELNIITLHLGNGSSACAIQNGKSIDTSMGFTPLEGLIMGSRSGDIDPQIVIYLQKELGYSADEVEEILNKRSGLIGICGEIDLREIMQRDDELSHIAIEMMVRRVKKYIGSYMALLGRVDAIAFCAGIGENSPTIRAKIVKNLELFGIELDDRANEENLIKISKQTSKIELFVIKTDEELEMALEANALLRED
ncbi:MAG: acetate kinase [Sulfurimonas sp.]|jgi:acetate kinase|uniref:acetate/propionate family kinase n=1 Tax=Sulfurimonas sp. TaxID=2022749 RepID=UPI00260C110C|nr:acetate kinase [Sulfurimonas sp.]MDD3475531.1 acetate kinase [Sulfurimonas sp.]